MASLAAGLAVEEGGGEQLRVCRLRGRETGPLQGHYLNSWHCHSCS